MGDPWEHKNGLLMRLWTKELMRVRLPGEELGKVS